MSAHRRGPYQYRTANRQPAAAVPPDAWADLIGTREDWHAVARTIEAMLPELEQKGKPGKGAPREPQKQQGATRRAANAAETQGILGKRAEVSGHGRTGQRSMA